jgi:spermidine dehydrogenase
MKPGGITRRDLLHGVALPLAGAALAGPVPWRLRPANRRAGAAAGEAVPAYPPARTGLRGSHPGSFEVVHALAWDGARWPRPGRQTDDVYDLVVVGAGLSGLAAAYLFRAQVGAQARILLLDNHDDFGGHAKRNEFQVDGRTLIGYGGSQSIDSPGTYSRVARSLIREIGIDTERFQRYFDQNFFRPPRPAPRRAVRVGAPRRRSIDRRRALRGRCRRAGALARGVSALERGAACPGPPVRR